MYFRMINKKAKWEQNREKQIDDLSSDIITNCLKTSDETLSLWRIENNSEIDDAIIALSSKRDLLQKLDYVIIPDEYLEKYSLSIKSTLGDSPYESFNEKHYDIINLNYALLGEVSSMILDIINNGGLKIIRVHEDQIKEKLDAALKKGILNVYAMKQSLLERISME